MRNSAQGFAGYGAWGKVSVAWAAGMLVAGGAAAAAMGPGMPKITFPSNDLYKVIGKINKSNGSDDQRANGIVAMHNGYMVLLYSRGAQTGGFSFIDISNPREPKLAYRHATGGAADIRDPHAFGFTTGYGSTHVCIQAKQGVQIWDWGDVSKPVMESYMRGTQLPGINDSDYDNGVWWSFYQAPYIILGGGGNGIYVVDARDPKRPTLLKKVSAPGFRVGPVFAVGNLLVATSMDRAGYATYDFSDPAKPVLLKKGGISIYSAMVNGNRIYGAGTDGKLHAHDISNPLELKLLKSSPKVGSKGGYITLSDGYAHLGTSEAYAKIDISDFSVAGKTAMTIKDGDWDFATGLGNLAVVGDDHGYGSFIIPHTAKPDAIGPEVNMVNPQSGATGRAATSRVGLTFTDIIDLASVNSMSIIVRPVGGQPLAGKYSHQTGIVNFSPDQPLKPNTTYEVAVPAGGVRDYAGNPSSKTFTSRFSTGSKLDPTVSVLRQVSGRSAQKWRRDGGYGPAGWVWPFEFDPTGRRLPVAP